MSKNLVRKNGADLSLSALSSSMNLTSKLVSKNQDDFYLSWWNELPLGWKKVFYSNLGLSVFDLEFSEFEFSKNLIENIKYIVNELTNLSTKVYQGSDYSSGLDLNFLKPMKSLSILDCGENVYGCECLNDFIHLTSLSLVIKESNEIEYLSNLTELECLDLTLYSPRQDYNLNVINRLTSLQVLRIKKDFGSVTIDSLDGLTQLKKLSLERLNVRYYPSLKKLKNLKELYLDDMETSSLGFISENVNLRKLDLHIGKDCYNDICGLVNLNELTFNIPSKDDFSLYFLRDMQWLEKIDFSFSSLLYGKASVVDLIKLNNYRLEYYSDSIRYVLKELKIPYKSNLFNENFEDLRIFKEINTECKIIIE